MTRIAAMVLISALLAVSSCSSTDDFTPTPPSPGGTIPTVGGTYSSPTMWQFEATSATGREAFTCAGSLTITVQVGDSFSGTYLILDANCGAAFGGQVAGGVLERDGSVSFELQFADGTANFLAQAFGCTYVSGDRIVHGTLIGNRLEVSGRTELDCVPEGRVTQVVRLAGNR